MTERQEQPERKNFTTIEVEVCTQCRGVGQHLSFTKDRKAVVISPCEKCAGTGVTCKLASQ